MSKNGFYDVVTTTRKQIEDLNQEIDVRINASPNGNHRALGLQMQTTKAVNMLANLLYLADLEGSQKEQKESPGTRAKRASNEYMGQFVRALSNNVSPVHVPEGAAERYRLLLDVLTETGGTPEGSEGGFLAPLFFDGMVYEQLRQYLDLADYVTVQPVTSFQGYRTVESAGPATEIAAVAENTEISDETETPTFSRINYQLVEYKGILPVSNDLWQDTPVNIMTYLSRWWAKKVAMRNNLLIQALIAALTPAPITDYTNSIEAIRTALNTTLDPLISESAAIFTNQTGYALLDGLSDGDGRPWIQQDGTLLRRPVVRLADRLWANDTEGGTAPLVVGNAREFITYFRRDMFELASTGESRTAWRNNNQEVRAILRADPEPVDSSAMVLMPITIPE